MANLPVIKSLTGRNPVISHPGTGLNGNHNPQTSGVKTILTTNSRQTKTLVRR